MYKVVYAIQFLIFDYLVVAARIIPGDEMRDRCQAMSYILMHEQGMTKAQIRETQKKYLANNIRDMRMSGQVLGKICHYKPIAELIMVIADIIKLGSLCLEEV